DVDALRHLQFLQHQRHAGRSGHGPGAHEQEQEQHKPAPPRLAVALPDPHGPILAQPAPDPRASPGSGAEARLPQSTVPVTRATASWAWRLSKWETVASKLATCGLVETTAATRRAASSQNMRLSALARAKACSSSRLTAVCTGVPSAASMASTSSSSG